jgi:16S rRNA U1498 N3-methylase RsmE
LEKLEYGGRIAKSHITLAQGISRSEKMDIIIEKATELGTKLVQNKII